MSFSEKFKYKESSVTMSDATGDDVNAYRSVSSLAIATLVFGLLSSICVVYREFFMFALPVLSIICAWLASKQIRRNPGIYAGRHLVTAGYLTAIGFTIVAGATYLYDQNRIPSDYQQIEFAQLQPTDKDAGSAVPQDSKILSDRKVFVRGYMSPGKGSVVKSFTLNSAQPDGCGHCAVDTKDTHHIFVKMAPGRSVNFTTRQLGVGGRFVVKDPPETNPDGSLRIYELEADFVR